MTQTISVLQGNGFRGTDIVNIGAHTMSETMLAQDYGYESDSDLEDDDTSDDSTLESSFEKDPSGSLLHAEHVMVRMTVFLITIFTR